MKNLSLIIIPLFIFSLAHATPGDIMECVKQGYSNLTNRRGIVAAVVDANDTKISTFGAATQNQIFEIGSLTKTFTGTLLADEIVRGKIKISDPIPAEYQKAGSVITYQHLTTHTSGIIPGNFEGFVGPNPESPYEGLTIPLFKDYYAQTPLATAPGTEWNYSNIGTGLLGLILAENNQTTYEELIQERIFKALGMTDTYFEVPASEASRFPQGNVNGQIFSHWDLYKTAINPAGGIRSTIVDMAKYARANLIPSSTPLKSTIEAAHVSLGDFPDFGISMGMNWILIPQASLVWHNGSTIGFNSILAVSTKHNVAVVAMTDTGVFNKDPNTGEDVMDESLQNVVFSCLK